MTRAEIRIAAAKRRAKAAEAALSKVYARHRAEREALRRKQNPRLRAVERKILEAHVALAVAELAALGITPMRTIILWHPDGYTAPSAQNRYVVRVTPAGWTRLVPVGETGAILAGRNELDGPSSSRWSEVTVTDEELKE